ncbi:hypothetical protein TcWFU_001742 [Taenia crassiceps]|uniref:KASH domain-containing protein n=1 Tax=Taenia crassiceps TaxID=6207 RepID=A0ABR4QPY2_9CEST
MPYSSCEKSKVRQVLSKLLTEILSLKHEFIHKHSKVDEFIFSRFHRKLMLIGARKRNIYKLTMNILARGSRTPCHESRCPESLKPLLRQINAVESEFHLVSVLMNPKDPLNHVDAVIEAIEHDLELNFCSLRQICCNLPHHQNWRQFLICLTNRDRDAAFKYYKFALKEVRLRSGCISSVHRLLNLLGGEKVTDQHLLTAVQRLTVSNTSCEALCYDLWLRLINMIVFLERHVPLKTDDKSTAFALDHLQSWQKVLSKSNHEVGKAFDKIKLLRRRRRSELWYSCLNDRLLFQMNRKFQKAAKVHVSQSKKSDRNVWLESGHKPLKSVHKQETNLVHRGSTVDTLDPDMSNGSSSDIQNSLMSNESEEGVTNFDQRTTVQKTGDNSQSNLPGLLNVSQRPRSGDLSSSPMAGKGPQSTHQKESRDFFRSPPSILHSETRKVIAQLSTGSDIMSASSPELILRETTLEGSKSRRVDSYLAAVGAAEMLVAQQHSNSNVEISTNKLRKSCSDDRLLKVALARARSLDDINGPQMGRTISLSHSLEDTISYPLGSSEHAISAWDNYQVPYYSIVEGIALFEPKPKLPENFFWEDLFPDETEARDFEQHFLQPQGTTRQIDEWSFEGLSGTPPSSQEFDDTTRSNDNGSRSSEALLEPADKNLFSDNDQETPLQCPIRHDKCLQTEMDDSFSGIITPSTFLNTTSQGAPPHDTNTTHTSGYESGADMVNCFFQRTSFPSLDCSNEADQPDLSTFLPTRSFGVQTVRNNLCKTSETIMEEPPGSYFPDYRVDSNVFTKSERDIVKLRDFLREILVSSDAGSEGSLTGTQLSKKQKHTTCSSACTGPKSIFHLMKSFSCMLESAERNTKLLRRSGTWNSQYREVLSNQWDAYAKWIHNHICELRNLNNYQERIHALLAKVNILSRISNAIPSQKSLLIKKHSLLSSQALISESCAVAEESETLREALLRQKLQMMSSTYPTIHNLPELTDLEVLFTNCLGNILDRTMHDVRSLAEQANGIKSAFIYLEALTEQLQMPPPVARDTVLNSDLDPGEEAVIASPTCVSEWVSSELSRSNIIKKYTLDQNRSVYQRQFSSASIVPPLFLLIVLIVLFCISGIVLSMEQYFPFRCLGNTWPGRRAVRIYQIGVPPL